MTWPMKVSSLRRHNMTFKPPPSSHWQGNHAQLAAPHLQLRLSQFLESLRQQVQILMQLFKHTHYPNRISLIWGCLSNMRVHLQYCHGIWPNVPYSYNAAVLGPSTWILLSWCLFHGNVIFYTPVNNIDFAFCSLITPTQCKTHGGL